MSVERIFSAARKRLVSIGDGAPLIDVAKLLLDSHTDLIVVHSYNELLVGVITKTDIVRQISRDPRSGGVPTSSVMTRAVIVCHPTDSLHNVWSTMKERHLKNLPVVDPLFRPIGVLSARDLLEVLLEEAEFEDLLLRDYVMGVGYG